MPTAHVWNGQFDDLGLPSSLNLFGVCSEEELADHHLQGSIKSRDSERYAKVKESYEGIKTRSLEELKPDS